MSVFDRVEEQLPHGLEQQRADVLPGGVGERVSGHLDHESVLVPCPLGQPSQRGGQSRTVQHGRKQLEAQRPCGRDRFVDVSFRLHERFVRTGSPLRFSLQLSIEGHRRADQQLLEAVVERVGELFARVLLGERQVGRHLAQLGRPAFQFGGSLLKRRPAARLRSVMSVTNAKACPPPEVAT